MENKEKIENEKVVEESVDKREETRIELKERLKMEIMKLLSDNVVKIVEGKEIIATVNAQLDLAHSEDIVKRMMSNMMRPRAPPEVMKARQEAKAKQKEETQK